ncbi:bifunctional UDP-N-acetylglucosamine diphosphorylase/glucosamine-1-phosphate N-acetyltransferase GlmU [Candidatus Symbiobacter mobilis]|uniref:bifunctional UDP-N-acetylglucosamine diphosphorylase/glucosamine-1-phosphate N-acetyltransferase GlmU n=1 Tax=Candidatus Symbiobacter mobilis TaxID=1436290 RepID=UPI00059E9C7C|nr:bifunctional UDP-N-acetylglucosamine diphosphorylase/glucosamine-1-phosphate N-acetyltransferase GlmU [Candidatus Symbiobacter mobilis]
MHNLDVVILAAGKGTRMKSRLPKVLHPLAGRPLLHHVVDLAYQLQARKVVVVTGHEAAMVEASIPACVPSMASAVPDIVCIRQEPQLGTGHAVMQALPACGDDTMVLVLCGDVPLTLPGTLQALLHASQGNQLALLTMEPLDPTGYGRIVREGDAVRAIVEQKDATPAQRAIREVYCGILAAPAQRLRSWLSRVKADNAQREYYLTDIVRLAVEDGFPVVTHCIADTVQVVGVNSPAQLAELERAYQRRVADALLDNGVRLADPARIDVRGVLECGQDVSIDVNCIFEGRVELGEGVHIGAHCVLRNVVVEAGARIHPFTHAEGSAPEEPVRIGTGALVGPFARLRPGAKLGADVHVGNFVEVKNSTLAEGAKANHLAYVGDATVGERVNFGAGSITANYDGVRKHHTHIGADVHIGSNCVLIAPVTIGAGGTIGAGSTVTRDTPNGTLTVARSRQVSIPGWKRPAKPGP